MLFLRLFVAIGATLSLTGAAIIPPLTRPENETSFWLNEAEAHVQQRLTASLNTDRARNAIVFVGSGMSMTTLAAARVHIGAEETLLSFETFPGVGMLRTYCVDQQVADSACSATALFGGAKSNLGTVGVTAAVKRGECEVPAAANQVVSIAEEALNAGKSVGIITTGRVTGPSVASLYAHSTDSSWETDVLVRAAGCNPSLVQDIAKQLVYGSVGSRLRVVLGGGRSGFRDRMSTDETPGLNGDRGDGRDLIREWQASKFEHNASYVWSRSQFAAINALETDYLLGLFGHSELRDTLLQQQEPDAQPDAQPTLEEMTQKAIEVLRRNEAGYLLVVVNTQIDMAHHRNWARVALDETAALDRAVRVVKGMTSERDTLLVVTADHSHTLTYTGYAIRHNDIFGIADYGTWVGDDQPVMTLSYAAGPGSVHNLRQNVGRRERIDPTTLDTSPRDFAFPATMAADREMHGGDDVAVYASGPWSHLFDGSTEQSVLAHVLRFAGCLGTQTADELNACNLDGVEV